MHPQIIEVTAGEVSDKLKRLGIGSDELVKITIESERELIPGRHEARARVVAAGLTDDDIDRLIKQAQHEVEARHSGARSSGRRLMRRLSSAALVFLARILYS
jgi:hypothetical protein